MLHSIKYKGDEEGEVVLLNKALDLCVIWNIRCEVHENCALLYNYAACSTNSSPTFRDNLPGPIKN